MTYPIQFISLVTGRPTSPLFLYFTSSELFCQHKLKIHVAMKIGKCIYCGQETDLNREHAFLQSLLQKGTAGWVIHKLCQICNSRLGELDNALSRRSHITFFWDTLQMELGTRDEGQHASIYYKRAGGVNPIRIPFPDPLYDNLISPPTTVGGWQKTACAIRGSATQTGFKESIRKTKTLQMNADGDPFISKSPLRSHGHT